MNLLIFILACYGMTAILTWGKIFKAIRPQHSFFHCSQCMGFWVGVVMFVAFWELGIKLFPHPLLGSFVMGCLSSGTSYAIDAIFGDCGVNINLTRNKENKDSLELFMKDE